MVKLDLPPGEALYPVPVVLVSCIDKTRGAPNVITIAWCGVACSKPPVLNVAIRPSRYSHSLIKETGDFVINIPTVDMMKKADFCGMHSGKDIDKFEECGFTCIPSKVVTSPIIKECPVNIECRLKNVISLGAHDMFLGEVVAVHADDAVCTGKGGKIDYGKANPFVYNQGEYWSLGEKIGFYGCSSG